MITEKLSLGKSDYPVIISGAVVAYLIAAIFLHSGPPELLEFVSKSCFLLIVAHFLKKVGITLQVLQAYDLKKALSDILKAGKYFILVSLGIVFVVLLVAGLLALGCYLSPSLSGLCANVAKTGNAAFTAQMLPPAFDSPLRTFFYLATLCFVVPIAEEIFFRRFVFVSLRKRYGRAYAITGSSIIFGIAHFGGFIVAATMGAFLAYVYEKEERLTIPIIIHALKNLTAILAGLAYYYLH